MGVKPRDLTGAWFGPCEVSVGIAVGTIRTENALYQFPVGAPGFEPGASCTPCKRASRAAPRPDLPG
jgi:hypothetical protein